MLNGRPGCQTRIYFKEPTLEPSQAQIRWYGNVARMQDLRLAKVVFFGELNSKHYRGQPRLRYKTLSSMQRKCAPWIVILGNSCPGQKSMARHSQERCLCGSMIWERYLKGVEGDTTAFKI